MKASLMALVFAMIINSVVGLFYYIRVITALCSSADETALPELSANGRMALVLITFCIILLGVYPGWLIEIIVKYVTL